MKNYCKCQLFSIETKTKIKKNPNQTHFGFETVDENVKPEKGTLYSFCLIITLYFLYHLIYFLLTLVYDVFEKVSESYDKMNDIMSFGIHRIWKNVFIQRLNPSPGIDLLDVAGGSGNFF